MTSKSWTRMPPPPAELTAFDAEALSEQEEAERLAARRRAARGGSDDPHVVGGERLQKVLAHAGVASRRACEVLISSGRVSVDGVIVTEAGVRVDPATQEIRVDNARVFDRLPMSSLSCCTNGRCGDHHGGSGEPSHCCRTGSPVGGRARRRARASRIRQARARGRLDTQTEGLLLLSNDGELAHRLIHPRYEIAKTYVAIVEGQAEHWVPRKLKRGIELDDGNARADRVIIKDSGPAGSIVEITLHSGRNRIVRRMLAAVGHPVSRLARTRLGPLTLGSLRPGQMRQLTGDEVAALQNEVGL